MRTQSHLLFIISFSQTPAHTTYAKSLEDNNLSYIKRVLIDKGLITVTLTDENEKNNLLSVLSPLGNEIDEIKVKEPTLNEIFVQFTEGQI